MSDPYTGRWKEDLLPRIHIMDALREAMESRHLSHPHHCWVMALSFLGYHVCKPFVEGCCLPSHATCCRENQRGEYATLDFPDSLSIFLLLGLFMSPVNRWGVCWTVGGCVWVEHPYIKKCILWRVPKTSCTDVYTGSIVSVCRVSCDTLPTKQLEWGLWLEMPGM